MIFKNLKLKSYLPDYIITSLKKLVPIIVILSLIELLSLGLLIPIIKIIITPAIIYQNKFLFSLWLKFGFTSEVIFVIALLFVVFLLFIVKLVFSYFLSKKQSDIIYGIVSKIINNKFNGFINKPFYLHANDDQSKELTSIISIPYSYSSGIILPIITIMSEGIIVSIVLIGISIVNFKIFLCLTSLLAPIFIIYLIYYKKKLKKISSLNELNQLRINKIVYEAVEGIREILVFNKSRVYEKRVANHVEELKKINIEYSVTTLVSPKMIELISVFALVVIVVVSFFSGFDLDYIASFLILFVVSMYRVIPSMNKILLSVNNIRANLYTIEYIVDGSGDNNLESGVESNQPIEFKNEIRIENLSFSYDGAGEILKAIFLTIKAGESIGITGPSGSGKSTLLNILLRLQIESAGGVFVDNQKLDLSNKKGWYSIVGFVPQNIVLFDGTLAENIVWAEKNEKFDELHLNRILELANLKKFVDGLEAGINTKIGDKGVKLSGGQRQRVAIARALYHKPKILIFDEATSSLDDESEKEITEAIRFLNNSNITIIVVAHRLQTLKYCNRIFFLEDGMLKKIQL